jgi:hypothetical protein
VFSHPDKQYDGDIFIFRVQQFQKLIDQAISVKGGAQKKFYLSKARQELDPQERWYLRTQGALSDISKGVVDVTSYRRNFAVLDC